MLHDKSIHDMCRYDMKRVVYFGHSAGGYLALWLCCLQTEIRLNLPFVPMLCVAVAPIGDLEVYKLKSSS